MLASYLPHSCAIRARTPGLFLHRADRVRFTGSSLVWCVVRVSPENTPGPGRGATPGKTIFIGADRETVYASGRDPLPARKTMVLHHPDHPGRHDPRPGAGRGHARRLEGPDHDRGRDHPVHHRAHPPARRGPADHPGPGLPARPGLLPGGQVPDEGLGPCSSWARSCSPWPWSSRTWTSGSPCSSSGLRDRIRTVSHSVFRSFPGSWPRSSASTPWPP